MAVESISALLTLQEILQFACFGDGHRFAGPSQSPWPPCLRPRGHTLVVLPQTVLYIFRNADVEFPLGVLDHVDAIHGIRAESRSFRKEQRIRKKLRG